MVEEKDKIPIDFLKEISEHCKHLTTLSSGFILVMVTFLDKLFEQNEWKFLVIVSFVSFAVTILTAVITQAFVIDYLYPQVELDTPKKGCLTAWVLITTWLGFTTGVVCLIIFAIKNFI